VWGGVLSLRTKGARYHQKEAPDWQFYPTIPKKKTECRGRRAGEISKIKGLAMGGGSRGNKSQGKKKRIRQLWGKTQLRQGWQMIVGGWKRGKQGGSWENVTDQEKKKPEAKTYPGEVLA